MNFYSTISFKNIPVRFTYIYTICSFDCLNKTVFKFALKESTYFEWLMPRTVPDPWSSDGKCTIAECFASGSCDQEEVLVYAVVPLCIGWRTAFTCFVYQQRDFESDPRGNRELVEQRWGDMRIPF